MISFQPLCLAGRLVWWLIGDSWRARIKKLAVFESLNSERVTGWDRLQFSFRTAAELGVIDVSMRCSNIEQPPSWYRLRSPWQMTHLS